MPRDDRGTLLKAHVGLTEEQLAQMKQSNEQVSELLNGIKSLPEQGDGTGWVTDLANLWMGL